MQSLQKFLKDQGRVLASVAIAGTLMAITVLPVPFAHTAPTANADSGNYVILSMYAGSPGSRFTVNGYGFGANEQVQATFAGLTVGANADSAGNFATPTFGVPYLPAGPYSVTVRGLTSGRTQTASYYVHGYYPTGGPSAYYIMPNQQIGFFGHNFATNESVKIFGPSNQLLTTATADGGGNFAVSNVYTVPFSMAASSQTFRLVGQTTGFNVSFSVVVGNFYPNINPSTYYLGRGQSFGVSGTGYAPNEPVDLYVGGTKMATVTADGGGNFGTSLTAPSSGGSFDLRGTGTLSGQSSMRTLSSY